MKLKDKKVAILVTDGFEQSEFEKPFSALQQEGAEIEVIALKEGAVKAWDEKNWGKEFSAGLAVKQARSENYDALVLPGGVISPDKLRVNEDVITFVGSFLKNKKPVAAICHGPWTLIETGMMNGRRVTSYKSIKTDLINAGANWVDEEVVVDNGLVTSRSPEDLPAFCKKMVEEIAEGAHSE